VWRLIPDRAAPAAELVRFPILLMAPQTLATSPEVQRPVAISADGRHLAFVAHESPRVSPDGTQVAVARRDQDGDMWIFDLARQHMDKLTSGPSLELNPVWTQDSRMLVFASQLGGTNVFRLHADGTGGVDALTSGANSLFPISVNRDGTRTVRRRWNER
jgi:dipeptidyl aminopeptidase/acylaminoacyl peptidase